MIKKFLLFIFFAIVGSSILFGQEVDNKLSKKELKARLKAEAKAKKEAQEEALYLEACQAIEDGCFVLEADRVEFKNGTTAHVSNITNFISSIDGKVTIQLTPISSPTGGLNGLGGITVEGSASNIKIKKNKKGDIIYSLMVQGVGISAGVIIRMYKGNNYCMATINPNFNNKKMNFTGYLLPGEKSNVYKGRSL